MLALDTQPIGDLVQDLYPEFETLTYDEGQHRHVQVFLEGEAAHTYTIYEGFSANGSLHVPGPLRGRGIGTRLVRAREELCTLLDIDHVIIGSNENPEFWSKLGYRWMRPDEIARFATRGCPFGKQGIYKAPMIKTL